MVKKKTDKKMTKHEEIIRLLAKSEEREISIFKQLEKIDKRLETLNGKVAVHEKEFVVIKTWGTVALLLAPIVINAIMRLI